MPFSLRENNDYFTRFVASHEIKTVLDVGPGFGTYARILRDNPGARKNLERLDAVEVWQPYVEQYHLNRHYDVVYIEDIRNVAKGSRRDISGYDLIIFGDVLEHMTREESLAVWDWASRNAKYAMISVPIIHWPQEGTENPYEAHLQEDLDADSITADYGPFVAWRGFQNTATFFKEF